MSNGMRWAPLLFLGIVCKITLAANAALVGCEPVKLGVAAGEGWKKLTLLHRPAGQPSVADEVNELKHSDAQVAVVVPNRDVVGGQEIVIGHVEDVEASMVPVQAWPTHHDHGKTLVGKLVVRRDSTDDTVTIDLSTKPELWVLR